MCHNYPMSNCAHCERPARAQGLCNAHYKKLLKYGDPLAGVTIMRGVPPVQRYLAWVDQRGPYACWPWTGGIDQKGYGIFGIDGGSVKAHRFGFTILVCVLQENETVDHTCHNGSGCPGGNGCPHRACQNPWHWEALEDWPNGARGNSFAAVNARKTACIWGHELTPENSYGYRGRRQCKTCARLAARGIHPRQLTHRLPAA